MSANRFLAPEGLFDASKNGFSHVAIAPAGAHLVVISGQWASDSAQRLVADDFVGQVRQTVGNVVRALRAAGLAPDDILKLTIYVVDYQPAIKSQLFEAAAPLLGVARFPASTIVPVPALAAHPGALIEIEAMATKAAEGRRPR